MDIPVAWEQILLDYAALEAENARLRTLLDEIHRGRAEAPPKPKPYDAAMESGK